MPDVDQTSEGECHAEDAAVAQPPDDAPEPSGESGNKDHDRPRIRAVEAIPVQDGARTLFALRDPMGHATGMITVPAPVLWLFQFFDGQNSRNDIKAHFYRNFSQLLTDENYDHIVRSLDDALFLDSERYCKHMIAVHQEFREAPIRAAAHAGRIYPDSPDELREQLEGFYLSDQGPGSLPDLSHPSKAAPVRAIVAPHIDLRSGGPCFAHAYHALASGPRPDLFVILGTGHAGLRRHFAATRKDFETPLGRLTTDAAFIDRLAERFGEELFEDEFVHRNEHVIEFQALFLQHLYGSETVKIAPILCSFAYQQLDDETSPEGAASVNRFVEALRDTIGETAGNVCVIASVDLAHIGPRYGDPQPIRPDQLEANERADRELLERVAARDVDGLVSQMRSEHDARRVCGFPCLYTMLRVLDSGAGRLLGYDAAEVDGAGSFVSFAGMVFD